MPGVCGPSTRALVATILLAPLATILGAGGRATGTTDEYVGVVPRRYADTRPGFDTFDGEFAGVGPVGGEPGGLELRVAGRGDVPSAVKAVALNVTATGAGASGHVTAWACDATLPTVSSLNYAAGQTVANAVITTVDVDGDVCLAAKSPVHVVVDVVGYFPMTSSYVPLLPARIDDTRSDPCVGPWNSSEPQQFSYLLSDDGVDPRCTYPYPKRLLTVPSSAEAAVLNLTAVNTAGAGLVSAKDCGGGGAPPPTSTLNFDHAGQVVAGLAITLASRATRMSAPELCFVGRNYGDIVTDLFGYFPAESGYTPISPHRVLDSRPGAVTGDGLEVGFGRTARLEEHPFAITGRLDGLLGSRNFGPVPSFDAAMLTVTVTGSDEPGWVALYPCGDDPTTSTVNFAPGQTVSNAAIVGSGEQGLVCYTTSQPVHVIIDLHGWV